MNREGEGETEKRRRIQKKLTQQRRKKSCNKFLTKKVPKPLDFWGQDEYNTLSTQENGVLNSPELAESPPGC